MPKKGCKQTLEHIRHKIKSHQEYWESLRGKSVPREIVDKQIQGRLEYYQTHQVNNKPHTEVTRKKISISMKRYWNNKQENGN